MDTARLPEFTNSATELLERPRDPNLRAGSILWDLYRSFYDPDLGRISPSVHHITSLAEQYVQGRLLPLGLSLGGAGRGAGLITCHDGSCLVVRTADSQPWAAGGGPQPWGAADNPERRVHVLPGVFQIRPRVAFGEELIVLLRFDDHASPLKMTPFRRKRSPSADEEFAEASRSIKAELCWEATAWGDTLQGMPALQKGRAWPAAFPIEDLDPVVQKSLEDRARDAASWCLDLEPERLRTIAVRITSGRQLQGGITPARVQVTLRAPDGINLNAKDVEQIKQKLESLIFSGSEELRADRLLAQKMRERSEAPHRLDRVMLCEVKVSERPSNHERLRLRALFSSSA